MEETRAVTDTGRLSCVPLATVDHHWQDHHEPEVHSSQHCFQDLVAVSVPPAEHDDHLGHESESRRTAHPSATPAAASTKFNGLLLEYPDIAIDRFAVAPVTSPNPAVLPSVFVLTHAHADHTQGLAQLPKGTQVHTSAATANWIKAYLDPALDHIEFVVHSLNHPFKLRLPPTSKKVTITFLDAHHCLGAVSVLVQSKAGPTVLHTGDFRFSQDMQALWMSPLFLPSLLRQPDQSGIDRVYLDTTFIGIRGPRDLDSVLEYPDKLTAINAVTLPSRSLLSHATRYFVRDCQLGHEPLLIALYNRFGYISELSPAMYAAYAAALAPPSPTDDDPIPWARPWPSPTALPSWLRPTTSPGLVVHVCDTPCRVLCRRTFYRISQGNVPESLRGASFGCIKACAQAFVRSPAHPSSATASRSESPPVYANYIRPIPDHAGTTQLLKVWLAQHSSVPELVRFMHLVRPTVAVSTTAASARDWVVFSEWLARLPGGVTCPPRFLGSTRKGIRWSDLERMMSGRRKASSGSSVVDVTGAVDPFELALVLSDDDDNNNSGSEGSDGDDENALVDCDGGLASGLQDTLDMDQWIKQQQQRHRQQSCLEPSRGGHASQKALEAMFALPPSDDGPEPVEALALPTPPPSDRQWKLAPNLCSDDGYSSSEADNENDQGERSFARLRPFGIDHLSMEQRVYEHWRERVHGKTDQLLHRLHMALLIQGRQQHQGASCELHPRNKCHLPQ